MDKEQQQNTSEKENLTDKADLKSTKEIKEDAEANSKTEKKQDEITPEEKIIELEDKLARTFAEMENQRRRFEREKEDAFEYGGFSFAKEALNLIDNLERSKHILENDEKEKIKKILKAPEENKRNGNSSSIEESIINQIRK